MARLDLPDPPRDEDGLQWPTVDELVDRIHAADGLRRPPENGSAGAAPETK